MSSLYAEIGNVIKYTNEYTQDDIFTKHIIERYLILGKCYTVRKREIDDISGNNWYMLGNPGDYADYYFPGEIFSMDFKKCFQRRYNLI